MLEKFKNLGKTISKQEQKNIKGSNWLPEGYCDDFDSDVSFNPNCDTDRDGRDCRFPFYINSFGRCTL
ncbi:hypothetical protein [uncultured Tenacibaculum sp.]|uniref:hypothetical protein n=1 Tax=uncultured Tenacibaculum sp. TaxID=174713 RepID=UPI002626B318|nr:hypothetical protein [uncultured Tenacibaculum sp.]